MHRDFVTHIVSTKTDFIISASKDGQLKFWKKSPHLIEFVKRYKAHIGGVSGMSASADGELLCTTSASDGTFKTYDVTIFGMLTISLEPSSSRSVVVYLSIR